MYNYAYEVEVCEHSKDQSCRESNQKFGSLNALTRYFFFSTLSGILAPYGHFLTIYTVWSTSSILVYSGCSHSLANGRSLFDYPELHFLGTSAYEVYFVNLYIVENHVITALYIALWSPGSLFVDVCGIGIIFHILHTSCLGLHVRLKLGSMDSSLKTLSH